MLLSGGVYNAPTGRRVALLPETIVYYMKILTYPIGDKKYGKQEAVPKTEEETAKPKSGKKDGPKNRLTASRKGGRHSQALRTL